MESLLEMKNEMKSIPYNVLSHKINIFYTKRDAQEFPYFTSLYLNR